METGIPLKTWHKAVRESKYTASPILRLYLKTVENEDPLLELQVPTTRLQFAVKILFTVAGIL